MSRPTARRRPRRARTAGSPSAVEVEVQDAPLGMIGIQVDDHQHDVTAVIADLRIGDDQGIVGLVEFGEAQSLQRRMFPADGIDRCGHNGASVPGWSKSRCPDLELLGMPIFFVGGEAGSFSHNSKPLYIPQLGESVAASTSRSANAAGGPLRSGPERISGVFGQKLGRMKSACSPASSSRYVRRPVGAVLVRSAR